MATKMSDVQFGHYTPHKNQKTAHAAITVTIALSVADQIRDRWELPSDAPLCCIVTVVAGTQQLLLSKPGPNERGLRFSQKGSIPGRLMLVARDKALPDIQRLPVTGLADTKFLIQPDGSVLIDSPTQLTEPRRMKKRRSVGGREEEPSPANATRAPARDGVRVDGLLQIGDQTYEVSVPVAEAFNFVARWGLARA